MTGTIDRTPVKLGTRCTAGEAVTAYVGEHVHRLRAGEMAVRNGEHDGVHDMRVAVRRLRSTVRTFGKVCGPVAFRGELKWLSDVLGEARDTQVTGRRLAAEIHATPVELVLGPVSAEVDRQLARTAALAQAELMSTIDSVRYVELARALDEFAPTGGKAGKRAARVLPPMVAKAYRRARRVTSRAESATGAARDGELHRVRKAVKAVRYGAELLVPVVGKPADRYRRRSRQVQRVLGDHHDYVVLRTTLRELGVQAHLDGANAFTFGLLHGRLGMAALQREQEFPRLWHKLASPKARRWLTS
ncbi:MAG TPA: CHAD domain-containing protein [Pseudonocardiaceae bacterium]|nr:CHAD domain-containing protein [Pseudonocardiaceae bacterium]